MPVEDVAYESPWSASQTDRADKLSDSGGGGGGSEIWDTRQCSAGNQLLPSTALTVPRPDLIETELSLSSRSQTEPLGLRVTFTVTFQNTP